MKSPPKATFWPQETQGTRYWRCDLPARYLPGRVAEFTYADIQPGETDDTKVFPRQAGAAVWQFPGNRTRALMMTGMRQNGIRVLAEVDDNYLFPFPHHTAWLPNMLPASSGDDSHSNECHRMIITRACDGVIVSTNALARAYREFNRNVYVCPNSVDPVDWPDLAARNDVDRPFRIGWAAAANHVFDAKLIRRAFEWAADQRDVEVVLFGLQPDFRGRNFRRVGWVDSLADYRHQLLDFDVGVCPLIDNEWSRCKSDLKAMEYAMAGALPVCSDVEPYSPWRGKPCLWAKGSNDFKRVLNWCITHQDEVKQMAREAREYVLKERTVEKNVHSWEAAVNGD